MRYVFAEHDDTTPQYHVEEDSMVPLDTTFDIEFDGVTTTIDSHLKNTYFMDYCKHTKYFVETGTYHGDTVKLAKASGMFEKIYSVELNDELFHNANEMFAGYNDIEIVHADSIDFLADLIPTLDNSATFFLDAHASGPLSGGKSGGTPLREELKLISQSKFKNHTIFIDDVRLLGSAEWDFVPKQIVMNDVEKINKFYNIEYIDGYLPRDLMVCYA